LEILEKRFQVVKKIKEYKKANNMEICDPEREKILKEKLLKKARERKLSEEFIIKIIDLILDNSKKIQGC